MNRIEVAPAPADLAFLWTATLTHDAGVTFCEEDAADILYGSGAADTRAPSRDDTPPLILPVDL